MKRFWLPLFAFLAFVFAACSDDDDCILECAGQCHGSPTPDCESDCRNKHCGITQETVGEAQGALTPTLSARWVIDSADLGSWCPNGTVFSDAATACVKPSATMIFEYPAPGAPVAAGARFMVNTTVSTYQNPGPIVAKVHVLKRDVVRPTIGLAGYCPGGSGTSGAVASWLRFGAGLWEVPGAKGTLDRSAASAPRVDVAGNILSDTIARHDATTTERWDVTALLNECPAQGSCFLALYLDSGVHLNAIGGTAVLQYDLAGPAAVCGDGVVEGAETCDDNNAMAGDGCSVACAVEPGFTCAGGASVCATTCGDGIKAGSEACDDGNLVSHDGCSAACVAEVCNWQ